MAPTVNGDRLTFRAPVTYPITARAIRIAGASDAPYRLINTSVENAIWISNNPGIRAGEGTPINPGTSLQWVNPTELFAVCATGLTATIILTTEIDDWQPDPVAIATAVLNSGNILVDTPVALLSAQTGGGTFTFDTSRYQSLSIVVERPQGSFATYGITEFRQNKSGATTPDYIRAIETPPGVAGTTSEYATWRGTMPCVADELEVSASAVHTVTVIASHRPMPLTQAVYYWDTNGLVVKEQFLTRLIPANGTMATGDTRFYTQPWFGDIDFSVSANLPGVANPTEKLVLTIQAWDTNAAAWGFVKQVLGTITQPRFDTWTATCRVPCSGTMYRMVCNNSSGSASNAGSFNATAVPVRTDL